MALFETIDPQFLKSKLDYIDLSVTGLRDALRGTNSKTLSDLDTDLTNIYGRLDVALSTRLAESTFTGRWDAGIYGWDGTTARKIKTDTNGELQVDILTMPSISIAERGFSNASDTPTRALVDVDRHVQTDVLTLPVTKGDWLSVIPNPSNLDVALSTRLADSKIPNALAQISRDIAGSTVYGLAVIASLAHDITRMPYMVDDISVSTTEASTSITAPGAKVVKVTNKGDTDCLIGVNASVPTSNPLKVRARTAKVFLFGGATAIYYKTASGSTTISIEWFN
jgi:hypothetical protein